MRALMSVNRKSLAALRSANITSMCISDGYNVCGVWGKRSLLAGCVRVFNSLYRNWMLLSTIALLR